jgi:Flp pilus assembly protein TadB
VRPGPPSTFLWLRLALIVLSVALAVFLFSVGSVIGGTLIAALAVVRATMLVEWTRRRRAFRRRFDTRDVR